MRFTLHMLKKEMSDRDHICLWCREKIPAGSEYYARKRDRFKRKYHISCVEKVIKNGQFDGLMFKEG